MSLPVRFSRRADRNLDELYRYIAARASPQIANRYVEAVIERCLALRSAPHCGTPRPTVGPGTRIIGSRRSATIYFVLRQEQVRILRIAYRGQRIEL